MKDGQRAVSGPPITGFAMRTGKPATSPLTSMLRRLYERIHSDPSGERLEDLASFLPVREIAGIPQFDYAVYSVKDGEECAELQASCYLRVDAERLFDGYRLTAQGDSTFFLVHWPERRVLNLFR